MGKYNSYTQSFSDNYEMDMGSLLRCILETRRHPRSTGFVGKAKSDRSSSTHMINGCVDPKPKP